MRKPYQTARAKPTGVTTHTPKGSIPNVTRLITGLFRLLLKEMKVGLQQLWFLSKNVVVRWNVDKVVGTSSEISVNQPNSRASFLY